MKKYIEAFSELFLRLLGICILLLPVLFFLNQYTDWGVRLKIGHGQGIDIPDTWQGLAFVEILLTILFLLSQLTYKLTQKKSTSQIHKLIANWKSRKITSCEWEITSYSLNQVPLISRLDLVATTFGKPDNANEYKLIYLNTGLDISYNQEQQTVAGFMFHFLPEDGYKPCLLKAKLNDGTWQTISAQDNQQSIRSLLGEPAASAQLTDGFSETFFWERSKIQVFYKLNATLNMLLFSIR